MILPYFGENTFFTNVSVFVYNYRMIILYDYTIFFSKKQCFRLSESKKIQSYFKGFYLPKASGAISLRPLYPHDGIYAEQAHHAHDLPLRFPLAFGA